MKFPVLSFLEKISGTFFRPVRESDRVSVCVAQ
jgi:hypothetical protein